jgi:hypothetical protein
VAFRVEHLAAIVPGGLETATAVDTSGDGKYQRREIAAAIREARSKQTPAGRNLRALFDSRLGAGSVDRRGAQARLVDWMAIESIAQKISKATILADLMKMCKDPAFESREVGTPGYDAVTVWAADRLRDAGFAPFGEVGPGGARTYFDSFAWRERYGDRKVTVSRNVVGVLPGKGPEPREAILIIAHLDNLSAAEKQSYRDREGRDFPSYEGANDNGAAVAAALEAARALAKASGRTRDIVVLLPSAEEEGLKGTEAFCKAPPIPLERFRAVINLEMIGQNATEELLVYGGETLAEAEANPLADRALDVAARSTIVLHRGETHDDGEGWYTRSDHYVTARAGIPSIMIHGRTDAGHYHTADDTVENLNLDKVRTVAELVFRIGIGLARDPKPAEQHGPSIAPLNHYFGEVWPNPDDAP